MVKNKVGEVPEPKCLLKPFSEYNSVINVNYNQFLGGHATLLTLLILGLLPIKELNCFHLYFYICLFEM